MEVSSMLKKLLEILNLKGLNLDIATAMFWNRFDEIEVLKNIHNWLIRLVIDRILSNGIILGSVTNWINVKTCYLLLLHYFMRLYEQSSASHESLRWFIKGKSTEYLQQKGFKI